MNGKYTVEERQKARQIKQINYRLRYRVMNIDTKSKLVEQKKQLIIELKGKYGGQ